MSETVLGAIVNAVPLAFIAWLFVSLSRRIDVLTTRVDRLYELHASILEKLLTR